MQSWRQRRWQGVDDVQKYRELAEYVVEEMRHAKVRPDTHTCSQVVSLYMRCGDMNEAAQALHVLSARMVSEDNAGQDINELFDDESAEQTGQDELFEEAVLSPQPLAQAAYTIALAGLAQGANDTLEAEKTPWATRLALQHERWKGSDMLLSWQDHLVIAEMCSYCSCGVEAK